MDQQLHQGYRAAALCVTWGSHGAPHPWSSWWPCGNTSSTYNCFLHVLTAWCWAVLLFCYMLLCVCDCMYCIHGADMQNQAVVSCFVTCCHGYVAACTYCMVLNCTFMFCCMLLYVCCCMYCIHGTDMHSQQFREQSCKLHPPFIPFPPLSCISQTGDSSTCVASWTLHVHWLQFWLWLWVLWLLLQLQFWCGCGCGCDCSCICLCT